MGGDDGREAALARLKQLEMRGARRVSLGGDRVEDLCNVLDHYEALLDENARMREELDRANHSAKRCTAIYDHALYGPHRCELPVHGDSDHFMGVPGFGWTKWNTTPQQPAPASAAAATCGARIPASTTKGLGADPLTVCARTPKHAELAHADAADNVLWLDLDPEGDHG